MRGLVIVLLIIVGLVSFSFVAASVTFKNNEKVENKQENKILEFSTFTSAVCERGKDVVRCKDEFFVSCNGEITKAIDIAECNGIRVDVPKALGFATFSKEWKDPRV